MRRICLALLVCLLLAPAARAQTPFTFLAEAKPGTLSTDERYAAFERPDGTVTVVDTQAGRSSNYARPAPDCVFRDVGGGKIMWECAKWPVRALTLKLRNGQTKERIVSTGEIGGAITEVGAYWVKAVGGDHRGGHHTSWWSLADQKYFVDDHGDARTVDDLNRPGLYRRVCAPLRKVTNPDYDGEWDNNPFLEYEYDGRFGLHFDQGRWTLDRCGRDKSYVLPLGAVGARLVAGRVVWAKGSKLAVRDPAARRSWSWRWTEIDENAERAFIRPTRHALFVATVEDDRGVAPERIYMAPFPG